MVKVNVSIIIPTYNNALYITDALESIFAQSYDSYEVIVINDGSTDNTRKVIEPYLNRVQYIYQEHSGVSSARNKGLTLATGNYVAFLDSDDLFFPDKLLKQTTIMDDNPDLGLVHSGWLLIDDSKKIISKKEPWSKAPNLNLTEWLSWQPIFLGAILFRRTWLNKTEKFNIELNQAEDTEFLLRLAMRGCPSGWLKEPTVYYRQHEKGLTSNSLERVICTNKVMENIFSSKEIPQAALTLEKNIKYQVLMWSVWLLYRSGHKNHIVNYLRKTLEYINGTPKHIIHGWLLSLIQNHRNDGDLNIENLQNFWPYFKETLNNQEEAFVQSERLFYWLLKSEMKLRSLQEKHFTGSEIIRGEIS